MKPKVVWRLRDQVAFDRALELRFAWNPSRSDRFDHMDRIRHTIEKAIEDAAAHTLPDADTERSLKFFTQRGDQKEQDWLHVRFRVFDAGATAEILSVEYLPTTI
jgi:hypothetical protein